MFLIFDFILITRILKQWGNSKFKIQNKCQIYKMKKISNVFFLPYFSYFLEKVIVFNSMHIIKYTLNCTYF